MSQTHRIAWNEQGGILFVIAAILLAAGWLVLPDVPTAPDKSLEFALGAANARFRAGATLLLVSIALEMIAAVALFGWLHSRRQTGLGLTGLAITLVAGALFLPAIGFFMVTTPVVGDLIKSGQTDALQVIDAYYEEPTAIVPFLAGAVYQLRSVVFGVAIWRTGAAWRWGGALLALGGILAVPAFLDVAVLQVVAPFVLAAAMAIVGVGLWRRPGPALEPPPG